ncbi:MAG: DegV family protein [Lachnospiraceae bacterium]|nr:DegV family protein [Lachnospiraceae bacterium]
MALVIITDSATDVSQRIKEKYNLHVIPTPVVIDDKDYFDCETIEPKQFYDIQRKGAKISTYHVSQQMFYDHFRPFAEKGDAVIYPCFSTGIAGTYQAAMLAVEELKEEFPDFDITVVDSKCASIGFGMIVVMALMMLEQGATKEEIVDGLMWHRDHLEHLFTVETLEYLYKGGRVKKTAYIAGGVLDIKPIIEVDDEGKLVPIEKIRTRKKAIARLVEIAKERSYDLKNSPVGVVHSDCYDTLKAFEETLKEKYGIEKFIEAQIGCAIGAHTGPGVIGVGFLNEKSPYADKYNFMDFDFS